MDVAVGVGGGVNSGTGVGDWLGANVSDGMDVGDEVTITVGDATGAGAQATTNKVSAKYISRCVFCTLSPDIFNRGVLYTRLCMA